MLNLSFSNTIRYAQIKSHVDNGDDDVLLKLIGDNNYYSTILKFREEVSEKVKRAIEVAEIIEK